MLLCLQPNNIFFSEKEPEKVKVGDFGLVKFVQENMPSDVETEHSTSGGTKLYMSPEQLVSNCKYITNMVSNCKLGYQSQGPENMLY